MSAQIEIKPVFLSMPGVEIPVKASAWQKVRNWVWNVARRPLVRIRQRELKQIAEDMKADLVRDLLPKLYKNRLTCPECVDAYLALNSEVFVSSMRLILTKMQCTDHYEWFNEFINAHYEQFERNEDVAAWIVGVKR